MTRKSPVEEINEDNLKVSEPGDAAAGPVAVVTAMHRGLTQSGVVRTVKSMHRINQRGGFDCPGCAWPDPLGHRKAAEFCENGIKAAAEENTTRTAGPDFWAAYSIDELADKTDYWLGQQGRITHPMVLRPGDTHYSPIPWAEAFRLAADHINATDPDRCVFYTSGRTANETAFLYGVFARCVGTNNLPDCSNMCHESTGKALNPVIGVGKGTVHLEDLHKAELILVMGQNPGSNHPRMLSALETCRKNGGKVVAVNPLKEAGLQGFMDPQKPTGMLGKPAQISDEYLQVRVGGDLALLQAFGHLLLKWEEQAPGTIVDREFIDSVTAGFDEYAAARSTIDWEATEKATGLTREEIEKVARMLADSKATVICWALGLTQQPQSVNTLKEIVNLLLVQGNFGKPGAGACPVRGHSNVQGDRTMGIWEAPPEWLLAATDKEFGITCPRSHGYDSTMALNALYEGKVDVFMQMGGNFASANSDTTHTEAGLKKCKLTIHVSTKPNRSHVVHGETSLILPTLGRTDKDIKHAAGPQFVTVEDSMSMIHSSQGRLDPVSDHLLAEPVIVCRLADAVFGDRFDIDWQAMADNYDVIRDRIERTIPGFDDFNTRVRQRNGFQLPSPPRDKRQFATAANKGHFTVSPFEWLPCPEGHLLLQTMRSHDQYNSTIYGLDDRYRGIDNARRVILVHPDDLATLGFNDRDMVDVISTYKGETRRVNSFRLVSYPTARGCAAAYMPEANPLVHRHLVARESNTPGFKAMVIHFVPEGQGR
ncbi:FdhF/YdeP family oxidoreductase [Corynebacterium mendelii]|uniref:FdhF/YdeP family oxidoreductase n=1 Tax=Corynebacterium mendelii TaxID=2765362 RepID=A0A939DZT4_9CORY|nr:FdhF/YdeP family oxidoreductase [Corynebacterium mendelii]MBN9643860.1 FdhF/YdeP family oxidoreductase [Corynebacterium mendelii]